jgi:hypothetical protein
VTLGENLSCFVANQLGSWKFVGILSTATAVWITWNVNVPKDKPFEPYPFVALNLCYSFLAGYTAPILLMSSSRQAAIDRKRSIENLNIDRTDHTRIDSMLHKIQAMEESLVEAVLQREDSSGRQPASVCASCGSKWGLWYKDGEYLGPETHFSTYKTTACGVCSKIKPCTEAADYGGLRLGWKKESK